MKTGFFRDNFLKLINDSVPVKVISKRTHLPWVNTSLKHLIRKKQRVYNRAKLYSREPDWSDYKSLQRQVSKSLKQQYKDYLNGMLSSKDKNPYGSGGFRGGARGAVAPPFLKSQEVQKNECIDIRTQ